MSDYPEPDSHIRDKVKVVLGLSNYVNKSNLVAKKKIRYFKSWSWQNRHLANIPTNLNNLKTKVDDLNIDNLKTVPIDLKTLSDAVS